MIQPQAKSGVLYAMQPELEVVDRPVQASMEKVQQWTTVIVNDDRSANTRKRSKLSPQSPTNHSLRRHHHFLLSQATP